MNEAESEAFGLSSEEFSSHSLGLALQYSLISAKSGRSRWTKDLKTSIIQRGSTYSSEKLNGVLSCPKKLGG